MLTDPYIGGNIQDALLVETKTIHSTRKTRLPTCNNKKESKKLAMKQPMKVKCQVGMLSASVHFA